MMLSAQLPGSFSSSTADGEQCLCSERPIRANDGLYISAQLNSETTKVNPEMKAKCVQLCTVRSVENSTIAGAYLD